LKQELDAGGGVSELDDAGGGGVSDEEGERKGASV
jgi:hypothetical protein